MLQSMWLRLVAFDVAKRRLPTAAMDILGAAVLSVALGWVVAATVITTEDGQDMISIVMLFLAILSMFVAPRWTLRPILISVTVYFGVRMGMAFAIGHHDRWLMVWLAGGFLPLLTFVQWLLLDNRRKRRNRG